MEAATQWAAIKHYGKQVCQNSQKGSNPMGRDTTQNQKPEHLFPVAGRDVQSFKSDSARKPESFDLFNLGLIKHRVIFNRVFPLRSPPQPQQPQQLLPHLPQLLQSQCQQLAPLRVHQVDQHSHRHSACQPRHATTQPRKKLNNKTMRKNYEPCLWLNRLVTITLASFDFWSRNRKQETFASNTLLPSVSIVWHMSWAHSQLTCVTHYLDQQLIGVTHVWIWWVKRGNCNWNLKYNSNLLERGDALLGFLLW